MTAPLASTGSRRRVLLVGSGLGGVLLGVLLLATVFGGGDDGDGVGASPLPAPTAAREPSVAVAPLPRGASAPVLADGSDPFHQIVTVPEAAPSALAPPPAAVPPAAVPPPAIPPDAAVPPAAGPAAGTAPGGPLPTVGPGQDAAGATQPSVPPGEAAAPPVERPAGGEHVYVELRSTFRDSSGVHRAHITVDDKSYTPAAGEEFFFGFRLEHIDGTCVEISTPHERVRLCRAAATP